MSFLVQSFDVDIGSNVVALRFREGEPRREISSNAWVMDGVASSSKGTVLNGLKERERERSVSIQYAML